MGRKSKAAVETARPQAVCEGCGKGIEADVKCDDCKGPAGVAAMPPEGYALSVFVSRDVEAWLRLIGMESGQSMGVVAAQQLEYARQEWPGG